MNTIYLDRAEIIRKIVEGDSHSGHYVLAVAPDGSEARIYWANDNRPWDDWPASWLTTPIPAAYPTGSGRDTEDAQDALQGALDPEAFAEAQRRHDEDEATWVELAQELLGEQWTDLIADYTADLADEWLWALNGAPSDLGGPGMWGARWTEDGCEPNEQPAAFAWLHKQPITLAEAAALYPVAYSTLAEAAREGRLQARQSGATWLTTRGAIERAIREGKLRPRRDPTIYRVAEDPEYWGPECTPEWGRELAAAMAQALRQYAEGHGLDVEVETVPETQSYGNRSQGDEDVIAELDAERERIRRVEVGSASAPPVGPKAGREEPRR